MTEVASAHLRLIYDSRGRETVEARIEASDGSVGVAGAPSGASTGVHEVQAFPSGGVAQALAMFQERVRSRLVHRSLDDQPGFDGLLHTLDGTPNFSAVGGNTATALSVAFALAGAVSSGQSLAHRVRPAGLSPGAFPAIVGNCLNGGRHAIGGPEIQEFHAFSPAPRPEDSVRASILVHRAVGQALHARWPKHALGRGDEGGWVAPIGNLEAIELLTEVCTSVRDTTKIPVFPGLDLAASEFYSDGRYRYREQTVDAEGQLGYLTHLVDRYGLRYIEDPFDQEDFGSFARLTKAVGSRALVVGDDLYTTSVVRLQRGIAQRSTNAVLIKVNQVGTVTDTLATVNLARENSIQTIASHRSGDLPEGWLAQFAVGIGAAGLKCGLLGGERVAKLNELLRQGAAVSPP